MVVYTQVETYSSGGTRAGVRIGQSSGTNKPYASCTFTTTSAYSIGKVDVWWRQAGADPSGTVVAKIYAVDGSKYPTGSPLATSNEALATAATGFTQKTYTFPAVALSNATQYAIVFVPSTGFGGTNYLEVASNNVSATGQLTAWSIAETSSYSDYSNPELIRMNVYSQPNDTTDAIFFGGGL